MRIVIDAMGSDRRPEPDVEGAVLAAREAKEHGLPDVIVLAGDKETVEHELAKHDIQGLPLEIVHASQAIEMHEKPSRALRKKSDSSMMIGMNMVKTGDADAFVTAGNTGAALALATVHTLRRIPGVHRPALTQLLRVENDHLVVLVDLGANADARPEWLVQFGIMGSLYAEHVLQQSRPRVALLSNGEEEGKGNKLVHATANLFPATGVNFIGNVEPKEVLRGGADVIVADGFVGNIMLKSLEAVGETMFRFLRRELTSNPLRMLGALLTKPALVKLYKQVDPFEIGGAPLLGVNGVIIVAHGRTNAKGIKNAVNQARQAVQANITSVIRQGMARYIAEAADENEINASFYKGGRRRSMVRWRGPRRRYRARRNANATSPS
jgi:glycerol-3-phosphate acyltransferase PlsX